MLTTAQLAILKSDILNDQILAAYPMTSDGAYAIAEAYKELVNFYVYKTGLPVQDAFDQVIWANYTPQDAPDGTLLWSTRQAACRSKQENLQTILIATQGSLNVARVNIRNGLQDAMTGLPSGAGGSIKSGGWTGLQAILYRQANRLEKLFATGTGTTAAPATMTIEGWISYTDVEKARA